ncbi:hypothetical protein EYF80_059360 [Liparis tanakae]|uniref:Uncharacterized protein n=1 Tax=Liparis tanakae TaxID=230148 RepID=A0A4Z2ENV9_9TELE|nr:hypothetical protein EYF80_059360 [Liparis tanakae]
MPRVETISPVLNKRQATRKCTGQSAAALHSVGARGHSRRAFYRSSESDSLESRGCAAVKMAGLVRDPGQDGRDREQCREESPEELADGKLTAQQV